MYCIRQDGICCFVPVTATCILGLCRPIYAGNALETVQCSADSLQMFSVRTTAFEKATTSESASAAVEPVSREDLAAAQVVTCPLSSTRQQTKSKASLKCLSARNLHMACLDDAYVCIAWACTIPACLGARVISFQHVMPP